MKLLVYTAQPTARVRYACKVLFGCILGCPAELTADWPEFLASPMPKLAYGSIGSSPDIPWLPAAPLLFESGIHPLSTEVQPYRERPAAFFLPGSGSALLPFDLLAFTFLLVTRYEEYLPFESDAHGRFPATASLAHKHNFLHRPILQEWGIELWEQLRGHFPAIPGYRPAFQFRPTYDVDMGWAYRYRPLWRQAAGLGRDIIQGDLPLALERLRVSLGVQNDPFYTFDKLAQLHQRYGLAPVYFLLLGQYGPYDKNLPPSGRAMQALVQKLASKAKTGLHPSYRSNVSRSQLQAEVQHYIQLTGQIPVRSRQHFLKLSFPSTYRRLLEAGIREDYTMGYADATGFRAGLSVPYPWYDLEAEAEQPLTIYPFAVMDVTLRQYLQLSPAQAITALKELIDKIKCTGGLFMPLWHNSSFAASHGWAGWEAVHETLLQYGSTES